MLRKCVSLRRYIFITLVQYIIASKLMLKHQYKSVHYDSFIGGKEFFTYSCYIICIYHYSKHKIADIIDIIYVYNCEHLRIVKIIYVSTFPMYDCSSDICLYRYLETYSHIHSQYCQYARQLIYNSLHCLTIHSNYLCHFIQANCITIYIHIKSAIILFIIIIKLNMYFDAMLFLILSL